MNKLYTDYLPPMLFGEELKQALCTYPKYNEEGRKLPVEQRFLQLMDIYKVFLPGNMAIEIYHKLYMMTAMSLRQKGTIASIRNGNATHQAYAIGEFCGVTSGASSITIIGTSGVGKTTCIQKAVQLLGPIIKIEQPLQKIIPAIIVSCPFDCSYKGFLYQSLSVLDEVLGTDFYTKAMRGNVNAQQLMNMVTQICRMHVGILIIDEVQFLAFSRTGKQFFRLLLQLINQAGIGVVMVGTPEVTEFFNQAPQMARRTTGLEYYNMKYGDEFSELCHVLFSLQYVQHKTELNEGLIAWLYEHTAGNVANLMGLIHDAQEIAILKGYEKLDIASMTEAYSHRMGMLHGFIKPENAVTSVSKKKNSGILDLPSGLIQDKFTLADLAEKAVNKDAISIYRQYFTVEEVIIC